MFFFKDLVLGMAFPENTLMSKYSKTLLVDKETFLAISKAVTNKT